jgi:cellulose synthase/poly-beta-1,6-N-acetylglucosamine synthase-like glycosyltransferase
MKTLVYTPTFNNKALHEQGVAMNAKRFFVSVMSEEQKLKFKALVALWISALIWFWVWWLRQDHIVTLWGLVINSIVIGWTLVLPGYYFFFVYRMKIANPEIKPPEGSYAMVVTKAPSEPWSVVAKTLTAMLGQTFPYKYDVWLATETIDDEIVAWCHKHNVQISCRDGVVSYQNAAFPRRSRSKEGNLTYFYEQAGGFAYDFISQLDADHAPTETYLLEMSRPFADPRVGYVAAPSICDANTEESWVVRARLYVEASMHGSLQAGYCRDWAPMPIGSHYMVRKTALQALVHRRDGNVVSVGTLGPELAEDHTTGLAMNSVGWRGAFALNAIAHGDGAGCFADSVTQEFQWATSLMRILLIWTKGYWSGLPLRLKLEYAFAQGWYPLYALFMFVAFLFPIIALVTGQPWVDVSLPEFILRSWVLIFTGVLVLNFVKRNGWLRPVDAPLFSWEMVFFQFVRWPWILYACLQATLGVLLKKDFAFRVTPKGWKGPKPLPFVTVLPYILIMLIEAGTAILVGNPGKASGYYYFCITYSLTYMVVLATIIVLHVKENWSKLDIPIVKYVGKPIAYAVIMAAYVMFAFILRFEVVTKTIMPGSDLYQNYTTFTTSLASLLPGQDGPSLPYQTAIDLIGDRLPINGQPGGWGELCVTDVTYQPCQSLSTNHVRTASSVAFTTP